VSGNETDDLEASISATAESPPPELPEPPPRHPNAAPAPGPPKKTPPRKAGLSAAPEDGGPNADYTAQDAQEAADQIYDRLRRFPQIGDPSQLGVYVYTMDGNERRLGDPIRFSDLIVPGTSPGQMLERIVIERFHMPLGARSSRYKCEFKWMQSGAYYMRQKITLGSVEEILALRRAEQASGSGVGGMPSGYVPPASAGAGYVRPPSEGATGNPEIAQMRAELAEMRGVLREAIGYARETRAAAAAPPAAVGAGAAPPPAPEVSVEERVATAVVGALKGLGLLPAPAPSGAAAPPNPNVAAGTAPTPKPTELEVLTTEIARGVTGLAKEIVGEMMGKMKTSVRQGFAGPPEEPEAEPDEAPEPAPPPPPPPPRAPFDLIDTGTKWGDGRPVMYPQTAGGDFDFKGFLFGNPTVIEGFGKVGEKVVDIAKGFADRVTMPDGTQVVDRTPRGAVDANPRGAGHAPPPQPAPGASAPGVGSPPSSPNASKPGPAAEHKPNGRPSSGGGFPSA